MNALLKTSLTLATLTLALQASAQVVLYENESFSGRSFTSEQQVRNFTNTGFNDRASSVVVLGNRWEVCENAGFTGRCVVLRPGRYASLADMGLNDRVSSVRNLGRNVNVADERYAPAPAPVPVFDNHRRNKERLFQADITSVRAVVGPPERRCWVEREQMPQQHGDINMPGTIVGAVIGGILGHQVGGGTGRDLATVGGVVAGGVVGNHVGRGQSKPGYSRDVQRCADVPSRQRTDFWDVTYDFRGQEHHIQMTTPPGATITVNRQGEPRA